ncbi:Alpha/Beta hydrolase protein [Lentinula raphanica]|uniref:Carboxylic ester hydrolase n=1 Tax=Lentinula raphanica TaxID=153919 RepID=A0AA38NY04_9AGAR|nr:Alpha/Beta hydrolase protein [Lentinula raphanica]
MLSLRIFTLVLEVCLALATSPLASPTVVLDSATVTGVRSGDTEEFLGIPFAQPPLGPLRFNLPQPILPYNMSFSATSMGPACPQQPLHLPNMSGLPDEVIDCIVNSIYGFIFPDDEDCLTINVIRPATASSTASSELPVLVWIFGGGFELGGPQMYDGATIVQRSIELDEPVIYVSMNYRVTAFGFLASQEVKDAGVGNLGLQDQREAFRWVQKYIEAFGGDPKKVTIWGQSAGAISVALHMVANGGDTEGLFRAGFMQSGSPIPVGDITHGQKYLNILCSRITTVVDYDAMVEATGCSGSNDTLNCMRGVEYPLIKAAVADASSIISYQSLNFPWLPRADGVLLSDDPQKLVQQGQVASIPIVSGDCDDEGTLFSLSNLNITTQSELSTYIRTVFPKISESDLAQLLTGYPADITQGSPFNTSIYNAITPEYKRISAFQGDAAFQAPRRFFLQNLSGKQPIWSFISKRLKDLPVLGSAHGTDTLNVYGGGDMADYLIRFAANLDPNGNTGIEWPQYTNSSPNMLQFNDGFPALSLSQDDYRESAMGLVTKVILANPV